MKLHIPLNLRKALLATFAVTTVLATSTAITSSADPIPLTINGGTYGDAYNDLTTLSITVSSGTATLTGYQNGFSGAYSIQSGKILFSDTNSGSSGSSSNGTVRGSISLSTGTEVGFFVNTGNTTNFTGVVSGTGNITKTGSGTLTMSGPTGNAGLVIQAGTVSFSSTSLSSLTLSGLNSAFHVTGSSLNVAGALNVTSSPGTINLNNHVMTVTGGTTLSSNLTVSSGGIGGSLVLNGLITDSGTRILDASGVKLDMKRGGTLTGTALKAATLNIGTTEAGGAYVKQTLALSGSSIVLADATSILTGDELSISSTTGNKLGNLNIADDASLTMTDGAQATTDKASAAGKQNIANNGTVSLTGAVGTAVGSGTKLEGGAMTGAGKIALDVNSELDVSSLNLAGTGVTNSIKGGSKVLSTGAVTLAGTTEVSGAGSILTAGGNVILSGANTITGIANGTKAAISSDNNLTLGVLAAVGTTSINTITDAVLRAGTGTDDKTLTVYGTTRTLDRNTITGQNLVFSSNGESTRSRVTLFGNISYSDLIIGTGNAVSGTNLTNKKGLVLKDGTLDLKAVGADAVTTTVGAATLLELDHVGTALAGNVVNLGDIVMEDTTGRTMLTLSNGTQAKGDSLTMAAHSFLAIDGTNGFVNTTLTMKSSAINWENSSGVSVMNNGHLVFDMGNLVITEANKNKLRWDASSEVKTSSGSIIFDGVRDDLTAAAPVRGEIVVVGYNDAQFDHGAQVFGSGVTSHNLELHDAETILQLHISDQSDTIWSKMAIADTISLANGTKLIIADKSVRALDLGVLGTVRATDSAISLTGVNDRADSLKTNTVSLKKSTLEVTDLTLNTSGVSLDSGSVATLSGAVLSGGISTAADSILDTVNLTNATVDKATINAGDVINMTTSTVTGILLLDGSTLNVLATGNNTIGTLALANNAQVIVANGADLTVATTGIGVGSGMQINGTVTGNISLMGGNATLASTGIIAGDLGIQGGTLTYNGGKVNGDLSFLANPVGNSVINLGTAWTLNTGKALAVNGNGTINMGADNMTVHGLTGSGTLTLTGTGMFTTDATATGNHTGDIVVNGSVNITANSNNSLGEAGSLIIASGTHSVTIGNDQIKGLNINSGTTVNMTATRDLQWDGLIDNKGTWNVSAANPLYLTKDGSNLGNMNLKAGSIALSTWQTSPRLVMTGGDITADAGTTFNVKASLLTAISMNLARLQGNAGRIDLSKGLTATEIDVNGLTVNAQSITSTGSTTLNGNASLTALGSITLAGITAIGDGASLKADAITLASTATLTSTGLSVTAGHTLALQSGTYTWNNSMVDVHDTMTLMNSVALTLNGGAAATYQVGTMFNNTGATLTLGNVAAVNALAVTNNGTLNIADGTFLTVSKDIISNGTLTAAGTLDGNKVTLSGTNTLTNGTVQAAGDLDITNAIMGTTTLSGKMITLAGTIGTSAGNTVIADKLDVNTAIAWNTSSVMVGATNIADGANLALSGNKAGTTSHQLGSVSNAGTMTVGTTATVAGATSVKNTGSLAIGTGSSLAVSGDVDSSRNLTIAGTLAANKVMFSGTNDLTNGTVKSGTTINIANATLSGTTLDSVGNMTVAGTLVGTGNNNLTSSEGNIVVDGSLSSTNNTLGAVKGTVDINAAISGDGLNVTAHDLVIDAALTTKGNGTDRGIINVAGTMDVNATASLTNVQLNVARTDIIGHNSSLVVTNDNDFGSLGNVTLDDHGSLTLTGEQSALAANIKVGNNSTVSITGTLLTGNILVNDDANMLTMNSSTVTGNVTLLGTANALSMDTSTITGTLKMDGGQFDLYGVNKVGELMLNTTNLNLTLHNGATLDATGKETVIDKNGLYVIEGTHTGDIRISNGTVDLGTTANKGTIAGNLALALGTLNYGNADSDISTGKVITLTGKSSDARDINVNANWDASGNTLIANADGTVNLTGGNMTLGSIASGKGKLTVKGNHDLTLNGPGAHTGDIVLNGEVDVTVNGSNALGTSGALKVDGLHTLSLANGADQTKNIQLVGGGNDVLTIIVENDDEATLNGIVTTGTEGDLIVKNGSGTLELAGTSNTIHTLDVMEGTVNVPGQAGMALGNRFGNLMVGGSEATLSLGYATLMNGAAISADDQGTINLSHVNGTSAGDVTVAGTGTVKINDSDLGVNSVDNKGVFGTDGTILNVSNLLGSTGTMTLKGSSSVKAGALASSGRLDIGSIAIGDRTKVNITTDATLSGATTIHSGSSLMAGQTVSIEGATTVDGTLAGKDIVLSGLNTIVNGNHGTISADRDLTVGAGSELNMGNSSSVTAGSNLGVGGTVVVDGSLAGGNLNIAGNGSVDSIGTINVSDKTTIDGNGSLSLESTGSSDLGNVTVNNESNILIDGNGNSIAADNIVMGDNASGTIIDSVINLDGGKGQITLNDQSSLDIANSTINGSITTTNISSTGSTHLGLDKVDINGDLTVVGGDLVLSDSNTVSGSLNISDTVNVTVNDKSGTPGTLVVKEGTTIDPNASLTLDSKSNLTSNVTMTGGSFTINGNATGNNFNGSLSFKPNDNLVYPGASAPVVTINGIHNQNMGITVDADATINVNGSLNINGSLSSGSNGDDTLAFNQNGETGEIVISSANEGFEDDVNIGGGTLVINANEAIGKDGTLSITGEDVTLRNTHAGATVSKDIATNGNGLTIRADEDFTLAGQIDAKDDTIIKTGDSDLVLSHDPVLNDAKSIIGTLDQTAGNVMIDGTDYTIGNLNVSEGLDFISLGGNTINNATAEEGSSIVLAATNPATNGSRADILGNSETEDGTVTLSGATLETEGTILGLAELNVLASASGTGSSATIVNSNGTITDTMVDAKSELTLDGSTILGNSITNSGTTNLTDSDVTLEDAIYVQDGGELNIDGTGTIDSDIVLSNGTVNILSGSSSVITKDSTLEFNGVSGNRLVNVHEDFSMNGNILMSSSGKLMVDSGKTMDVNGGFDGSADLHKTGLGILSFNKAGADYDGTLRLTEGTIAATTSNAYGSASSLCIDGNDVKVVMGTKEGSPVVFDSGLTVDGNRAFTVNTLSHTTWNGLLTGTKGTMTKLSNETLLITNANSRKFTTSIKVNEGALALNGNIGSNITLDKGTMLSGNGSTAGHVNALSDNTIIEIGEAGKAWSGSNGGVETLTLGSAAFERSEADCMGVYKTGTTTIIDLDLVNNASDKLIVTGKADLNNSLVEIRKGAYTREQERGIADGTRFHIVEAGVLAGAFHDEVQHDLYLRNAHLENTSTGTDLVLSINHKGADKTANQTRISNVVEGIDNDGIATNELLDMVNAFKHTKSETEAKDALESVGGTRLTTMMSSMLAGNINHLRTLRSSMGTGTYAVAVTPDAKGGMISHGRSDTEVWVSPTAAYNKVNGDDNAPGFSRSAWGAMMGAERSVDANTMLGVSLGYDYARTEVRGATDETDTYNIDLYGTYTKGAWLSRASVGVGFHDFTNDRFVSVGDRFAHMSRGGTNGMSLNFSYELSRAFKIDATSTIAPLFTFESSAGWIGSYTEKGDIGNAGLHLDRQDAWSTVLGLGGRYTKDFVLVNGAPSSKVEALAMMTFDVGDQGSSVGAQFQGAPGRGFTLNPAANSRVGALIGAGLTVPFNDRLSGFGGSTFEFRSGTRDFTANIGVRYSF